MRLPDVAVLVLILAGSAASPAAGQDGAVVSDVEYEGWRQYNVHCARCHGQDALPNPVTANLLTSLAPGGATAEQGAFTKVVIGGRADRGMPAFEKMTTPEQVDAIYAYLKGRAEKRIPPGRPKESAAKRASPG